MNGYGIQEALFENPSSAILVPESATEKGDNYFLLN